MTESLYRRGPRWKVGHPTHPSHDDHGFGTEQLAFWAARERSREDFKVPVAVWDMEDCRIVRLFIAGQEFRSV